jgi:2',3'-cyclic-nucleotide 2'-phosphodiesterase (5'-nucleotidase family)
MRRTRIQTILAIVVAACTACATPIRAQQEEPSSPRARTPLTLLQINDVYSTLPVDGLGGVARIATVKREMAAAGRTPLLVIAGDFLSPSVASSVFKGEQMVAAFNAAGLDIATLGNHEFDFGPDVLLQRMAEAKWQWVISNVVDSRTGRPVGNAAPYVVKTYGALRVAFLGLCLTTDEITPDKLGHLRLIDPMQAAATYLPMIKSEGANVVVAVTHLPYEDDRSLADRFPEIDVIIGGHEHYPITATENRTLISKAGSDGKFIARIDVNRGAQGQVERFFELIPITSAIADDPATLEVANRYEARLDAELNVVVGTTRVALDANAIHLRSGETNLGDMVADAMRGEVGADMTIINAGGIRGDRVYPAGQLTRRTLVGISPFGNVICKIAVPGHVILSALENGASRLPASDGRFPQVSGLTIKVAAAAAAGRRITEVLIGGQRLDPDKTYTVATTDYQLKGGDGYSMFRDQRVIVGPEGGPLIATAIEKYVAARGEINPVADGRIVVLQ